MYLRRISDANLWRDEALGRIKSDPRRIGIIPRREERSPFRCRLERFRDDYGDRLIGVTDLIALQQIEAKREGICLFIRILCERRPVRRRNDINDARMSFRRFNVEKRDAAARDAAHGQNGVKHPGRMVIGGVAGLPRNFEDPITTRERLTYVRSVPNVSGPAGYRDLSHA
jgi:hypothetical protein